MSNQDLKKVSDITSGEIRKATHTLVGRISGVLPESSDKELKKIRDIVKSFLSDFTKVHKYTPEARERLIKEMKDQNAPDMLFKNMFPDQSVYIPQPAPQNQSVQNGH